MLFHAVMGDRVYLAESRSREQHTSGQYHFFWADESLAYIPFCYDFGPMNLSCVVRFSELLEGELAKYPDHSLVFCVENTQHQITNGAFLLGSYMVLKVGLSVEAVWSAFDDISDRFGGYRDAASEIPDFFLSLVDCWRGLSRASSLGWIDQYDMDEYLHYDSPLEGDLHELVPGRLVAFRGPRSLPAPQFYRDESGSRTFTPEFYLDVFGDMRVSTVVRLNEAEYDDQSFASNGIAVIGLEFPDCTAPPLAVVTAFLAVVRDAAPSAVAVHCKAGLGRTGTLAAAHLMAACGFGARDAIGWLRIVRPGSVIGEQQHFLCYLEPSLCPGPRPAAPPASACLPRPRSASITPLERSLLPILENDSDGECPAGGCTADDDSILRKAAAHRVAEGALGAGRVRAKLLQLRAGGRT